MSESSVFDDVFGFEGLRGEGHIHNGGGMSFGGGEVNQSAFGQEVDAFAVI